VKEALERRGREWSSKSSKSSGGGGRLVIVDVWGGVLGEAAGVVGGVLNGRCSG
jgi:hypothetical protein